MRRDVEQHRRRGPSGSRRRLASGGVAGRAAADGRARAVQDHAPAAQRVAGGPAFPERRKTRVCEAHQGGKQALEQRRLNPRHHVQKIVALSESYGTEAVARAMADAFAFQAFSCEYIANVLESRARLRPQGLTGW